MADQEKWDLSREEIERRLQQLNQEKKEPTRGGRSSGQGVKPISVNIKYEKSIILDLGTCAVPDPVCLRYKF